MRSCRQRHISHAAGADYFAMRATSEDGQRDSAALAAAILITREISGFPPQNYIASLAAFAARHDDDCRQSAPPRTLRHGPPSLPLPPEADRCLTSRCA